MLAVYLSSRSPTDEARAADLGRGVVVTIVLTIALAWVQHEGEQRAARDSLEFTLASGQSFVGINLTGRDLRGFYLAGKDFRDAKRDATLEGAALGSIRRDETTTWPPGFDPAEPAPKPEPLLPPAGAKADVVRRVVDGDTLVLAALGGVRLLGIDAPQPEARPAECYAEESRAVVERMLAPGESVRYTPGVVPRDIFGRSQAYVWLANGAFVKEGILGRGAARVLISPPNVAYADRFRAAAVRAADTDR